MAGRYRDGWVIKGGKEIQGEMGYKVWQGDTGRDGSFSVDGRYRERWVIKGGREIPVCIKCLIFHICFM